MSVKKFSIEGHTAPSMYFNGLICPTIYLEIKLGNMFVVKTYKVVDNYSQLTRVMI